MSSILHFIQSIVAILKIPRIWRLGLSLLLGIGLSVFLATRAQAAETVLLQNLDAQLEVPISELQVFAYEGVASPELSEFLQNVSPNPEEIRSWLTTEITPPYRPSSTSIISTDFVLLRINKTLGDKLGRENLQPLQVAFKHTLEDDAAFSILEILEDYPASEVRLDLGRLQQIYSDVSLFLTRIEPVLQVAQKLLPELVCDCNAVQAPARDTDTPQSGLPGADRPFQPTNIETNAERIYGETKQTFHSILFSPDFLPSTSSAVTPVLPASELSVPEPLTPELSTLIATTNAEISAYRNREMVLAFGPFRPSISIQELTTFAETGELSPGWRFYLRVANVAPENLRKALNQRVNIELKLLDKVLNTLPGEFLLYKVGGIVHTRSDVANIQAMRSALVLSAATNSNLSLLEVLQNYPSPQITIDGARLARLGKNINKFKQSGGVGGAVVDLEGWLLQLQASVAEEICVCDGEGKIVNVEPIPNFQPVVAPSISATELAEFLPANWQPVASHREDRGIVKVVWLQGTPYEMGYQHGKLLHDEIASIGQEVLTAVRFAGKGLALGRLATRRSYPDVVEECRGLTDATQDIGMTVDACMVLAYGDVYQEIFSYTLPKELFWDGCNQFVAANQATVDGRLYHGSSVDNSKEPIPYIINNPVVFVRQPTGRLPHAFVTYPGVVWPNSGVNIAGISLGLDTAHPADAKELAFDGRSNVQIMRSILETATNFAEASEILETQPRVRANLIMITDGKTKQAGVFEFTGKSLKVRPLQDNGVLYVTNHFVTQEMYEKQPLPIDPSSQSRFKRFQQLMEPDGVSSYYGKFEPETMVKVLRDRVNPTTMQPSSFDVFDDNASPGGNGSLRQALYDPDRLLLWVAAGQPPVPQNPFQCFSLGELLNLPNATPCQAPAIQ